MLLQKNISKVQLKENACVRDGEDQGAGRLLLRYAVDALGARSVDVNEQNEQAVGFIC